MEATFKPESEAQKIVDEFVSEALALMSLGGKRAELTKESIDDISAIVELYRKDMPWLKLIRNIKGITHRDILIMANRWGCAVGEILRHEFGGEWKITNRGDQKVLTLDINGQEIIPLIAVWDRILRKSRYTVKEYYRDMVNGLS